MANLITLTYDEKNAFLILLNSVIFAEFYNYILEIVNSLLDVAKEITVPKVVVTFGGK